MRLKEGAVYPPYCLKQYCTSGDGCVVTERICLFKCLSETIFHRCKRSNNARRMLNSPFYRKTQIFYYTFPTYALVSDSCVSSLVKMKQQTLFPAHEFFTCCDKGRKCFFFGSSICH